MHAWPGRADELLGQNVSNIGELFERNIGQRDELLVELDSGSS